MSTVIEDSAKWNASVQNVIFPHAFQCEIKHIPVKRAFDILFSLVILITGLPLFLGIALAIRFTSKGSVLYSHERIGRGGIPFRCYKFRTMYADADARLDEILKKDLCRLNEWQQTHKLKDDPRITPVGNFLRRTSLDELPQFWNVLKGDLSVVGPRPVVQEEIVNHIGDKAQKILSIRPGLTGIWQVSGRSDTSYRTRVMLDEKYVDTHSFLLDLKLIVKTIPRMIFSKGAY
jgi:undecaprenyl-phosphate galactose phosphotransferase